MFIEVIITTSYSESCCNFIDFCLFPGRTGLCMRLALLFVFIITLSIWQISAFKLDEFSYSAALSLDFQVQHSMIDLKKIISLSS